jgi:hypothetical protein
MPSERTAADLSTVHCRRRTFAPRRGRAFRRSVPPATVARVTRQHQVDDSLPALPSPNATDDERGEAIMARLVARSAPQLRRLPSCLRRVW